MKDKKGLSAIVATVLIILITVAAVTIIWAAIIPMINNELAIDRYSIYLNETKVSNIIYKTVNSIEMIESGRYPDYLFCYSYCIELGRAYNSTEITDNCNKKCIQELGVDDIMYDHNLKKEWIDGNCELTEKPLACNTESICSEMPGTNEGYKCGDYKVEVKGR